MGIAKGLIRAAKEGFPVYSISSDLQGSTGLKGFHTECPDRYIDVGVAESNMVSTAVGMSKVGLIPVVDTFAAFGVTKGNLPLIMGSLSQAPVIAVFSHTGFQDAADGASHQSLTYLSALSSIPHLNVVNVASAREAEEYIYQAVRKISSDREAGKDGESYIFFVGRENFALEVKEDLRYLLHVPQRLTSGTDLAIVVSGSLAEKGLMAQAELSKKGISATVINHSFVNHSDFAQIAKWIGESGSRLITVEDHQLIGGMGAQLVHQLKLSGLEFHVKSLAVKGEFGQSAYSADELYTKHKLDADAIVKAGVELMNTKSPIEMIESKVKELKGIIADKDFDRVKDLIGNSKEEAQKKVEELMSKYDKEELKVQAQKTAGMVLDTANSLLGQLKERMKK